MRFRGVMWVHFRLATPHVNASTYISKCKLWWRCRPLDLCKEFNSLRLYGKSLITVHVVSLLVWDYIVCNIVYITAAVKKATFFFQCRVNGVRWNVDCHPWDKVWWENGLIFCEALYEQTALCIFSNIRLSKERWVLFVVNYTRVFCGVHHNTWNKDCLH